MRMLRRDVLLLI